MRSIAEEQCRCNGPALDDREPSLSECLAGFTKYFDDNFSVLLPLDVSEAVPPTIYHESGMCELTRRCHLKGCSNVDDPAADEIAELADGLSAQKLCANITSTNGSTT